MSHDSATGPLADRYGRPPAPLTRRTWALVAVGGALVVVAVLAWLGTGVLRDPVRWQDYGFQVEPTQVVMTFEVTKDPEATVECRLLALNQSAAEVGFRTVQVGPAGTSVVRLTENVSTAELAVTGTVESCVVVTGG